MDNDMYIGLDVTKRAVANLTLIQSSGGTYNDLESMSLYKLLILVSF
jgi:hypothetical protein